MRLSTIARTEPGHDCSRSGFHNRAGSITRNRAWIGRSSTGLLVLASLVLAGLAGPCHGSRSVRKERVQLAEQTGEANPRLDQVEFDPVLAEMEQEADDEVWRELHGADPEEEVLDEAFYRDGNGADMGTGDAEDFLLEHRINITDRLIKLFPLIDLDSDGQLSTAELTGWHVKLGEQASMHRTRREIEAGDKDKDEKMTLEEALSSMGVDSPTDESHAEMRSAFTERFHLADFDVDGLLNLTEFHDFLHPEESENPALVFGLLKEEMRRRDLDGDGRINADEYEMTTHREVEHLMGEHLEPHEALQAHWEAGGYVDHEATKRHEQAKVQSSFERVDLNGDGFIDADEFRPLLRHIWPSQRDFAVHHSRDLVKQADLDDDEHLTLAEMLEHPHAFYHTVEEEDDYKHDEL